jgi:DNA-binding LacI/PurR family transcriptional regulator
MMSVIGFDDIPLAAYATPPLTTVRQPVAALARAAAMLLLDAIEGVTTVTAPDNGLTRDADVPSSPSREPRKLLLMPELIVRRSTAVITEHASSPIW